MAREKSNLFKNVCFSIKTIWKIDKVFIFQKLLVSILGSVNPFIYAYVLKVAIAGIENNLSFKEVILSVLLIIILAFILTALLRIINAASYRSNLITIILNHQTTIRTLKIDYEKLERPETQDLLEKSLRSLGQYTGVMGLIERFFLSLQYFLTFLIASVIVVSVNWLLLVIIVLFSIMKVLLENRNQRRKKREVYDVTPPIWRRINYSNSISGNLGIAKDLRIYRMDKFINQERELAVGDYLEIVEKDMRKDLLTRAIVELFAILDGLFLYGFMIYEVIYNNMTISSFTFMVTSVFQLIRALYQLIKNNGNLLYNSLQVNDYRSFMNIDLSNDEGLVDIEFNEVEIEFRNVYFSYYLQEGYALEDVSFKIKAGEKIALVGYNGAGKTTIVKLLAGFYKPTKGEILLNGVNILTIKKESLAQIMAPVFQETIFFPFTIGENIAMSLRANESKVKIEDIIKLVKIDEKINSLPAGIKTILSRDLDDKGIELSGGESQKLSLARAIYKASPLFILDEPTSALDAISEYEMYKNFNKITNTSTTIYISHRLSSTRFCDQIILLDKGRVVEVGCHDDLIDNNGSYAELFNMQAKYYQDDGEENGK